MDNHAWQSDNETSSNVAEALESVNELETNLDQSKESMYKLSYVVRVSANDLDELKRRCNEVKDFYDDLSVKLVRPFGDMLGLHEEFLPASKRYMNDYIQYVTSFGNVNIKTVPCGLLSLTFISPPCAIIIDLHKLRPIPIPLLLSATVEFAV